jgi:hypothetical protein
MTKCRPRHKWHGSIMKEMLKIGCMLGSYRLLLDGAQWSAVLNKELNLCVKYNVHNFLLAKHTSF